MTINEEKIKELLLSNNIDDVILGCRIAAEHLGEEWCRDNFISSKYITDNLGHEYILLKFNDFSIWIGTNYIEYINDKNRENLVMPKIARDRSTISFETK